MNARLGVWLTGFALVLSAAPVMAHHSFAAEYDANKPVTLKGAVTKIEWTNPHARFYVDVKDDKGTVTNWNLELASPNVLTRNGWTRKSLNVGDQISSGVPRQLCLRGSSHEAGSVHNHVDQTAQRGTQQDRIAYDATAYTPSRDHRVRRQQACPWDCRTPPSRRRGRHRRRAFRAAAARSPGSAHASLDDNAESLGHRVVRTAAGRGQARSARGACRPPS